VATDRERRPAPSITHRLLWRQLHDLANAQPSPTAAAFWLFHSRVYRHSWPVHWLEAVSRARPEAARGTQRSEYRTGEDVGEAAPLMLMEAIEPIGKGVGQGQRPQRLSPQTVGQEPTRDATEEVAQAKRGGFPVATDWRDRGRSIVTKRNPAEAGLRVSVPTLATAEGKPVQCFACCRRIQFGLVS
jgi:hypothetical protein